MTDEQNSLWASQERGYLRQQFDIMLADVANGLIDLSDPTAPVEDVTGKSTTVNTKKIATKKRKKQEKKICAACGHEMSMKALNCPNCQLDQETAEAIMFARADPSTASSTLASKQKRRNSKKIVRQFVEGTTGDVECKVVEVKPFQSVSTISQHLKTEADDPPACSVIMQLPPVLVNPSSVQDKLSDIKRILQTLVWMGR